ncbi:MAG TPA: S53 family peptidase [Ktedonobacteraceae bacterium]
MYSMIAAIALCASLTGIAQAAPVPGSNSQQHVAIQKLIGAIPLWKSARKISTTGAIRAASTSIPPCLDNPTPSPIAPRCYSPQQIRNAYDVTGLLKAGITGKGRTIVIIDASSSPTLQSDVHLYDQLYGLKDPKLNVIAPFGVPPVNPSIYVETALDVETAHSLAPDATIDLLLTGDTTKVTTIEGLFYDLLAPVKYAVDHNLGDVISISYGAGESCFDKTYLHYEHEIFEQAQQKGISVFVSAGDSGAAILSCSSPASEIGLFSGKGTSIPASDPLVSSVGGTTLNATVGAGKYVSETTWNEDAVFDGATGGGFSSVFPRPGYQDGLPGVGRYRGLPDVSWDADPLTGVPVVVSILGGTYILPVGGTSVGAPAWAGLTALFNQYAGKRLGFLNGAFYRILKSKSYGSTFQDIKTGNNSVNGFDVNGKLVPVIGYNAGPGWDAVTGVGTPDVDDLAVLLKQYVH